MNNVESKVNQSLLFKDISQLIESSRKDVVHKISKSGVLLYWHIGQRINVEILKLNRAEYGKDIISEVSKLLHGKFGHGFGWRVIYRCVQFVRLYSEEVVVQALSNHLRWSHFVALLNIKESVKREFYAEMCRLERWSVKRLKTNMGNMLYERTALAKQPEPVIKDEIQ
ncbi:MAG: DUF1016 N-terminal domain-containing protein [Coxiellaceae bacterium]|nr:DUF1016 N-terminal domain-containing protein [Coxiellaceae bacterium]